MLTYARTGKYYVYIRYIHIFTLSEVNTSVLLRFSPCSIVEVCVRMCVFVAVFLYALHTSRLHFNVKYNSNFMGS